MKRKGWNQFSMPLSMLLGAILYLSSNLALASTQPYITSHGINFGSGNKYQVETDLNITTPVDTLALKRTYNSQSKETGIMGYGWTISFGERLKVESDKVVLIQPGGRHVHFKPNGSGAWTNETGKVRTITQTATGYQLTEPSGTVKTYNTVGNILSEHGRNNTSLTYTYSGTLLSSVSDSFGNSTSFTYTNNRITNLITPVGTYGYAYDANNNLVSVSKPDGTSRQYIYDDPNDVNNLTGIIDEAGTRVVTLTYDTDDRVTTSSKANGSDQYTIEYLPDSQRRITDSLGVSTTYTLEVMYGIIRVKSFTGPGCSACGSDTGSAYVYNTRQQLTQVTDAKGNVTTYQYDAQGNKISETEAVGTPEERTTSWTYDPATNKIATITKDSVSNPGQLSSTSMNYDANGNLLGKSESGYSATTAISRATSYSYDPYGRITSINGPRTDVNDTTAIAYYPNTPDQEQNRGFLQSVTNALGHSTTYSQYNGFGRPELITTPNGTTTAITYDASGRVKTRNTSGIVQSYTYDPAGILTRIDLPEGRFVEYTYDAEGRATAITDNTGNSIAYAYDAKGNKIHEEIKDPEGMLQRFVNFTYEQTGDLDKTILADGRTEDLNYDMVGNLVQRINAAGTATSYQYDALNRLTAMIEPGEVVTGYAYDANNNVTAVTDAAGHATTFIHDDFGRRISRLSPDTGQTLYTYDEADNLLTKTDAKGITVSYQYDALNRVIAVHYPDSSQDVTYTYDLWENGIGRLSLMHDATGETSYLYDAMGRVVATTRPMAGLSFSIDYGYNQNSELVSVVYPGGRTIDYQRDGSGRITAVISTYEGVAETLAQEGTYLPFGPLTGMTLGNGMNITNTYDQVYRLTSAAAGTVYDRSYQYSVTGLVKNITDNMNPAATQNFLYDDLNRLVNAQGSYGVMSYAYDKVGNRLNKTGTTAENYTYATGTNRLAEVNGDQLIGYEYDAAGNILAKGEDSFSYDQADRVTSVSRLSEVVGEYGYDSNNLRTVKTVNGETVYSLYDANGFLLAEYDATGKVLQEYAYAYGQMLAMFDYRYVGGTGRGNDGAPPGQEDRNEDKKMPPGQEKTPPGQDKKGEHFDSLPNLPPEVIEKVLPYYVPFTYYFINDHLGTPQVVVDNTAQVVWQGEYQPFGQVDVVVNTLDNNLRFPGQYFDSETGLHYNWNRYYDPASGRYISADPIGLDGGMNLYAYVEGNPVNAFDLMGLKECTETCSLKEGVFKQNAVSHRLWGGKASSLTWHEKCPEEYPEFDSACLVLKDEDYVPYSPNHPFPWEARELSNGKQVFNVSSSTSTIGRLTGSDNLSNVRMCYKCCKCD